MSIAEATFLLAIFNSLAVPLLLAGWKWTRRVERRLTRLERVNGLHAHPFNTTN